MTSNTILNNLALRRVNLTQGFDSAPWPHFEPDEIEAAVHVLESGKINYKTGEEGIRFENEFAAYTGCKHAIAVANGTVALELALYGLGIGAGDEVVVPAAHLLRRRVVLSCVERSLSLQMLTPRVRP